MDARRSRCSVGVVFEAVENAHQAHCNASLAMGSFLGRKVILCFKEDIRFEPSGT
jgi:hypothetical protein